MARTVEFVVVFNDGIRKRHYHRSEKGKVISFMDQLALIRNKSRQKLPHSPSPPAGERGG